MRLTTHQIAILTGLAKKHFGEAAQIRLFGSRTNDLVRGGDIDVHVVAPNSTREMGSDPNFPLFLCALLQVLFYTVSYDTSKH